jgi:opacity protein-like surface antigen
MSRYYGRTAIALLLGVSSHAAFSMTQQTSLANTPTKLSPSSLVITLSGGPAWESAGQKQTLNLSSSIQKTYTADQPTNTLGQGELFLGIQKPLTTIIQGQLGLAVGATSNATLSGDIWDDGDSEFNNYSYQYQIKHQDIMLKGKLLGNWGWGFMPWVSAGLGIGFNRSHDFTNTPTITEALPTANFSSNTTASFTYTLGLGIEHALNKHWQIGAGYEFADWGQSELGRAKGQTIGEGPSLSHLYTNAFLLNLSFIA